MSEDLGGKWITVKGRRVFLKDGEDFGQAWERNQKISEIKAKMETASRFGKIALEKELAELDPNFAKEKEAKDAELKDRLANSAKMAEEDAVRRREERKRALEEEAKRAEEKRLEDEIGEYKFEKTTQKGQIERLSKLKEEDLEELYHGGNAEAVDALKRHVSIMGVKEREDKFGSGSGGNRFGLSTTYDQKIANDFAMGGQKGKVAKIYLDKNAKTKVIDKHFDDMTNAEIKQMVDDGVQVIRFNKGSQHDGEREVRIIDPKVVFSELEYKKVFK